MGHADREGTGRPTEPEENTEEVAEENTEEAEATDSTNTDTSAVVEESTEE